MSDTEAKLDEQNVDNGMQEAEAKKEDVNVDVENADNEIEVEKKQDESDATPIVNKSAGIAVLQAALRPRGQQAKAHRVGEDVFCVLVEGLLLALSDKSSSQYFHHSVALKGEFDGVSYFDELGEEHIVEGCHFRGFAFLIYARAACFIRHFLI